MAPGRMLLASVRSGVSSRGGGVRDCRMPRFLTLALGALLLFGAGSSWLALYPPVAADTAGIETEGRESRAVAIPVGPRESLRAIVEPGEGRAVVVLLHGYARDERRLRRHARYLVRDGYAVVAVRFRSSAGWGRRPTTLGAHELTDARAVLDWVAVQPQWRGRKVVLFGESLGGSVALALAAERPEVSAVIADDPFARADWAIEDRLRLEYHVPAWPLAPIARALAARVTGHDPGALDMRQPLAALADRPVLLIRGAIEDHLGHRHAQAIDEAAGSRAESWTVAGAGHAGAWAHDASAYERRVRAFLSVALTGRPLLTFERADAQGSVR